MKIKRTSGVVAIIQARLQSTRFPQKVFRRLAGKPVLDHVVQRVCAAHQIESVVVATTINKLDLNIVGWCVQHGVPVYVGSEFDVLDRFYQAARLYQAKHIVRVTADCPAIDPKIIDTVLSHHFKKGADYTSNTFPATFPDGEDVEVFTFAALTRAWQRATLTSDREHVTPYFKKHPNLFLLENVVSATDESSQRWTLDEPEDYEFLKRIFRGLYPRNNFFGIEEILSFLRTIPSLTQINGHIGRNEGYQKSLQQDKEVRVGRNK